MDPGETVAFGADTATEVARDEEVGGVHGRVAVAAEKCGIGGTIERSSVAAKLASPAHGHTDLAANEIMRELEKSVDEKMKQKEKTEERFREIVRIIMYALLVTVSHINTPGDYRIIAYLK